MRERALFFSVCTAGELKKKKKDYMFTFDKVILVTSLCVEREVDALLTILRANAQSLITMEAFIHTKISVM